MLWHNTIEEVTRSGSSFHSAGAVASTQYVDLGAEIAVDGHLTPRVIGDAARTGRYNEQDLKKVWHYVARFGSVYTHTADSKSTAYR
jgi:hypothetical protein